MYFLGFLVGALVFCLCKCIYWNIKGTTPISDKKEQ